MSLQKYRAWNVVGDEIPAHVVVEDLRDEHDGLVIQLRAEDGTVGLKVSFDQVVAYRNIDESYRHRTWRSENWPKASMLVVENSHWVEWLRAESDGVLDEIELKHFAIFTSDDCIDIVTKAEPKLEIAGATPT